MLYDLRNPSLRDKIYEQSLKREEKKSVETVKNAETARGRELKETKKEKNEKS